MQPLQLRHAVLIALAAGCSSEPSRFLVPEMEAGADAGTVDAGIEDAGVPVDRGTIPIRDNGPSLDMTVVYAHSDTVLYAVNPRTNALTMVGTFTFPAGDTNSHVMTDLAVDANGIIVGTTHDALYRINPSSAACSLLTPLPGGHEFVGLTYLPVGVLDPAAEVLVGGAVDGSYWRIDPSSGMSTMLGQLRQGSTTYQLSGDFVSVEGAGTFATVRRPGVSATTPDQLASVNPMTGAITLLGSTNFVKIYGLAYYRNTLFGFTRTGQFISINITTGRGTMVSMPAMQFSGAGVTTLAPTAPG